VMIDEDFVGSKTPYLGRASACEHEERASGLRTRVHVAPPEHICWGELPVLRATTTH
jgi:hypothetical protein